MPRVVVPASVWMCPKAAIKLAAMIRLRRDGAMSKTAKVGSIIIIVSNRTLVSTQKQALQTPHRTPDAQSWCSRLGMDVPEGRNQTSCNDSPAQRRGDVEDSENRVDLHHTIGPRFHLETGAVDLIPHSGCPAFVFPPRYGCARRPQANQLP